MIAAAERGREEVVPMLLEAKANPNLKDKVGWLGGRVHLVHVLSQPHLHFVSPSPLSGRTVSRRYCRLLSRAT